MRSVWTNDSDQGYVIIPDIEEYDGGIMQVLNLKSTRTIRCEKRHRKYMNMTVEQANEKNEKTLPGSNSCRRKMGT